jgi:uncharacterized protein
MPLFAVICTDKPNALDLRMATRPQHLEYLAAQGDKIKAGGPFLNEAGEMMGSMSIIEVESRAEAEASAAGDPYAKADLFQSVEIRAWRQVVGSVG